MLLNFQNNVICHITLVLFIAIAFKQQFVKAIVRKYRLESANLVDVYYPITNGDSIKFSENEVKSQNIIFPGRKEGKFFVGSFRTINAVPVLLWRFLHKRFLRWYSTGPEGQLHSFWNKTTRTGLDIDLAVPANEFRNIRTKIYSVYPGTMWCGIGNKAEDDYSIGFFYATDSCCRQHDKCFDSIPGETARYGLTNAGQFTRSHCECDMKFYYCLKRTKSFVAHKIGVTYFNILRPQCFRMEHPIIDCISWHDGRCLTYVVDETKPPIWQWFDNKDF